MRLLFKSYNELPENYEKTWEIDMMKNKGFAVVINIAAVVVAAAMVTFFFLLGGNIAFDLGMEGLLQLFLLLVGMIVTTVLHELIHGLFFKLGTREKLKIKFHVLYASASVPTAYFKKWHYFLVGLAPFIIIDLILAAICLCLAGSSWLFFVYFMLTIHTAGCVGDFFISYKLLRAGPDTLIMDTGTGMVFYNPVSTVPQNNL